MDSLPVTLLAALTVKAVLVASLRVAIGRRVHGMLDAWVAAWLVVQTAMIAAFLLLSFGRVLSPVSLWCLLAAGLVAALTATRPHRLRARLAADWRSLAGGNDRNALALAATGAAVVVAALCLHAWFFYDTTDDGLNYGLARIALWYQQQSVFVRVPDRLFQVFAWEWNSDLNVLFYFLATGRDQACAFSNIESWLVLSLAAGTFVRSFGGSRLAAAGAVLAACTMPALLYLSLTIKSEPSALAGVLAGCAWLRRAWPERQSVPFHVLGLLALAFAAGCKISCLPLVGLLGAVLLGRLLCHPAGGVRVGAAVVVLVLLLNARHLVNLVQYGGLLDAVSNQPRGWQPEKLLGNLDGVLSGTFARSLELQLHHALFATGGATGLFTLGLAAGCGPVIAHAARTEYRVFGPGAVFLLAVAFAGSCLFFAGSLPWFAWSFRYYLPWLLPAVLLVHAFAHRADAPSAPSNAALGLPAGALFVALLHLFAVMRPSEVTPGASLGAAFRQAAAATPLERKLAGRPAGTVAVFAQNLGASGAQPRRIGVLGGEFSLYFPLFGDDLIHRVEFLDALPDLERFCRSDEGDLVVFTAPAPWAEGAQAAVEGAGYVASGAAGNLRFYRRRAAPPVIP